MRTSDGVDWEDDNSNVWDVLCKQEENREKCYAITLSVAMFALLPAFLQLLNTFVSNENINGYGKQTKKIMLLCTIASYTILGIAAWCATCFMREDRVKRVFFFWGFTFFCNEAALLSMLVLWYQNHLEEGDCALFKLTCSIWIAFGLITAFVNEINFFETNKLDTRSLVEEINNHELKRNEKEQEGLFTMSKTVTRNSLSRVLLVSSHALLLGFIDIAYHAYFKYNEPWMAIATIVAYFQMIVVAICLRVPQPEAEDEIIMNMNTNLATWSSMVAVMYGAFLLLSSREEEDSYYRSFGCKLHCVLLISHVIIVASTIDYASSKLKQA